VALLFSQSTTARLSCQGDCINIALTARLVDTPSSESAPIMLRPATCLKDSVIFVWAQNGVRHVCTKNPNIFVFRVRFTCDVFSKLLTAKMKVNYTYMQLITHLHLVLKSRFVSYTSIPPFSFQYLLHFKVIYQSQHELRKFHLALPVLFS
jgi:hypothetical protein